MKKYENAGNRAEVPKLFLALLLASPLMAGQASGAPLRSAITIRVVDFAGVPGEMLLQAQTIAAYILSKAGVEVNWLDCDLADVEPGTSCNQSPGMADLWVRIVIAGPRQINADVLGAAALDATQGTGQYATIFYSSGKNVAETSQAAAFPILGAAMAHEIGHLLLGANHSSKGIMCGNWHREELQRLGKGALLFTREQGEDLRAEIMRRKASAETQQ